ncbi:hypothetical protein KSD_33180 [Ktedonobacter sp. SOSP1-85]|nr:hypothetical protein KSD_33180 [Ktedonobacter sp. SOSP1-85]
MQLPAIRIPILWNKYILVLHGQEVWIDVCMWIVPQAAVCRNILGSICTWVLLDKFHLDNVTALF